MGKGSKSKREMVVLVRKLKRARALKKVAPKTFSRPAEAETVAQN